MALSATLIHTTISCVFAAAFGQQPTHYNDDLAFVNSRFQSNNSYKGGRDGNQSAAALHTEPCKINILSWSYIYSTVQCGGAVQ